MDQSDKIPDEKLPCVTEGVIFAYCSKDVAINGALGQCYSLSKSKSFVSDKVVGKGGTHAWYLGSIDPLKTITFVYETKESDSKFEVKSTQFSTTIFS
jgi:protein transport protein SEC23